MPRCHFSSNGNVYKCQGNVIDKNGKTNLTNEICDYNMESDLMHDLEVQLEYGVLSAFAIQSMSFGCWSIQSGASTVKVTPGSENDIDWDDTKIILGILQHNDSIEHLDMKIITPENADNKGKNDVKDEIWKHFQNMLNVNKSLHSINLNDSPFNCPKCIASIYFSENKTLKWITSKNMAMGGRISQGYFIVDKEWKVIHSLLLDRLLESDIDLKKFYNRKQKKKEKKTSAATN